MKKDSELEPFNQKQQCLVCQLISSIIIPQYKVLISPIGDQQTTEHYEINNR